MKLMLDTNTCIAIIKRKPVQALQKFEEYQVGDIGVSAVTLAELRYGVAKSQHQTKNQAALEKQGTPIGPLDTMIGAHALSLGAMLVTNNTRGFERIVGLAVVDWIDNH